MNMLHHLCYGISITTLVVFNHPTDALRNNLRLKYT